MGMIPSAWLMVKSVYDENRRRRRRTLSNSRRARDPGSITFTQAFDTPTTPPALAPQKACTDYGRKFFFTPTPSFWYKNMAAVVLGRES